MIAVAIADDHALFREGLRQIITLQTDMSIAWEAKDGVETIAFLQKMQCDVLVVEKRRINGAAFAEKKR